MLTDVYVSCSLPRWQFECINHLAAVPGIVLRLRPVPIVPAGRSWWWLARRCCMLAPMDEPPLTGNILPMETGAGDLIINLVGTETVKALPHFGVPVWRLVRADGLSLSAPYPFAADWSRPGRTGSVFMINNDERVLQAAHLSTNGKVYTRILDEILKIAALLPAQAMRARKRPLPTLSRLEAPAAASGRRGTASTLTLGAIRYAAKRLCDLPRVEVWRVGLADQPIQRFLDESANPHIDWLTPQEGAAYCADPFSHPDDPDDIWWERYDYHSRCGVLERARPLENQRKEGVRLGVDVHLSYPFLVRIDGQVVLIPEMSASGTTRLYSVGLDGCLKHIASLPVPGVDPILYCWAGRYWLGLTHADIDARSNYCLWHATDLSGPWTPHANNPVKIDVRSARNAGTPFWHNGRLYRPSQDCSQSYGGAVAINRVLECTPETYNEEVVAVVRPKAHWPVREGIHTVSSCRERTLIDAKTSVLSVSGLTSKIRRLWPKKQVIANRTTIVD